MAQQPDSVPSFERDWRQCPAMLHKYKIPVVNFREPSEEDKKNNIRSCVHFRAYLWKLNMLKKYCIFEYWQNYPQGTDNRHKFFQFCQHYGIPEVWMLFDGYTAIKNEDESIITKMDNNIQKSKDLQGLFKLASEVIESKERDISDNAESTAILLKGLLPREYSAASAEEIEGLDSETTESPQTSPTAQEIISF
ncbi:MAG: hypothetical protein ACPG2Y_02740 [Acholeplasmataceae bacterium]